jgi:hypothetical protein
MNFQDRIETKKGNEGESIIDEMLSSLGYTIYAPITDNAHSFDRLISYEKKSLMILEIKSKAKRKYFPDTGINYSCYIEYKEKSKLLNLDVLLIFIDEENRSVYGNKLRILEEKEIVNYNGKEIEYPLLGKDNFIIYFSMNKMIHLFNLSSEQCIKLKQLTNKKLKYI